MMFKKPHYPLRKLAILGSALFVCLFAATWGYQQYVQGVFRGQLESVAEKNHELFRISLSLVYNNMLQLATFVANDSDIQQLFLQGKQAVAESDGDFDALPVRQARWAMIAKLRDNWTAIQGRFHARQLHFHLGPGSQSFLRLHKPHKFGDRMDDVRYTIVDTNQEHTPRVGFETGRVYSGLRGVVPVFAEMRGREQPVHVGALEAGTSFRNIIELLKKHLQSEIAIALTGEHVKNNMWSEAVEKQFVRRQSQCDCFIEASTSDDIVRILDNKRIRVPDTGQQTSLMELDGRTVAVTYFALRDYRGTRNPELEKVGGIFIWWDVSAEMGASYREQVISAIIGLLLFLFALYGIHVILERREIMARQARLMRELEFQKFALDQHAIVSATDIKGNITYANDKFCQVSGYSRDELLGQNHRLLKTAAHPPEMWKAMWQTVARGEVWHGEVRNRAKSGRRYWVASSIVPFMDEDGKPESYISIRTDISERKKAEEKLSGALDIITQSIDYAANIQRSILPPDEHLKNFLADHFIIWEPRDNVGGDIYWSPKWGDGLPLILADCTGHGVPGAFVTLIATGALERALEETEAGDVAGLLRQMHRHVRLSLGQQDGTGKTDDGLDLGICYIDTRRARLVFAGARFSLFRLKDGEVVEIRGNRPGIGYRSTPFEVEFTARVMRIEQGARYYMSSDGLLDQVGGPRRRMFGKKRFLSLLQNIGHLPMSEQKQAVLQALADYQDGEIRRDDVSVIGFRI